MQHDIKELSHNRNVTRRKRGELMVSLKDKEFQLSIENDDLQELIEGVDKCEIDQTKENMHSLEMEIQDVHKSFEAYDQDMKVIFTNKEKEIGVGLIESVKILTMNEI